MCEVTKDFVLAAAERFLQDGGCTGLSCKCCPFDDTGKLRSLGYHGTNPCEGVSTTSISDEGHELLADIVAWARSDDVAPSSQARAAKCFEVGHWYRYDGPKERAPFWNNQGMMDFVLDGKPHLCVESIDWNAGEGNFLAWFWGSTQRHFVEVPAPCDVVPPPPRRLTVGDRVAVGDVMLKYCGDDVVQATTTRPFDSSRLGVSTPASRARRTLRSL